MTNKNNVIPEELKQFVRNEADKFLSQSNINSIGIGYKEVDGKKTKELTIQFTVDQKSVPEGLEALGTTELPKSININGVEYSTDVIQRSYKTSLKAVELSSKIETSFQRKSFADPIMPGISISHPTLTAGTTGCVVYDATTGEELILSNWHVLQGLQGQIGDEIVQPGPHDDNRVNRNFAGYLERSHLGVAGDCAVAKIVNRGLDPNIHELNVAVEKIAEPELGDKVIKSGRTTGVTRGIVRRVHITVQLNYGTKINPVYENIGCFEIGPDPRHRAVNGEISMPGDSGGSWMHVKGTKPSPTMLGLHFAGEMVGEPEHALACYPASVFEKLAITPNRKIIATLERARKGFLEDFLGGSLFLPKPLNQGIKDDLLEVGGSVIFDYTHFSLAMSKSRKLARWVAWNIDGSSIKRISRKGIKFVKDSRLPLDSQLGNELYKNNPLDRGHIARRADLVWGTRSEAKRANVDSFHYTNIAPQHSEFNQSKAGGIWGELEDAVFDNVDVNDLKVSVMAGPVFTDDDPVHRGVRLPKSFWKIIYYREQEQKSIKAVAYMLTQEDLLNQLETLELPEFAVYEVSVNELQDRIGLDLANVRHRKASNKIETIGSNTDIRKIESIDDIIM